MNEIFKFVCDHSHAILQLSLTLCVLFVTIFKKKVKIDDVFQQVLLVLPDFIQYAEKNFSDGSLKYSYVFNRCIKLLVSLTHQDKMKVIDTYTSSIDCAIENILSTPQKK